jgi:uncharacterized protein YgiM (DUF1202 family)
VNLIVSGKIEGRGLRMRSRPGADGNVIAILQGGEKVAILEQDSVVQSKLGKKNQYLHVRNTSGQNGYCAAWLLEVSGRLSDPHQATPVDFMVVVTDKIGKNKLRLRLQPDSSSMTLAGESIGAILKVIEPRSSGLIKIGVNGQWLHVQDSQGRQGFVTAYYVKEFKSPATIPIGDQQLDKNRERIPPAYQSITTPDPTRLSPELDPQQASLLSELTPLPAPDYGQVVSPPPVPPETPPAPLMFRVSNFASAGGLRLRSEPNLTGTVQEILPKGSWLQVLEPEPIALSKVGVNNQWLQVKTRSGRTGYTAAWFLEAPGSKPDQELPPPIPDIPAQQIPPQPGLQVYPVPILSQENLFGNAACVPASVCMLLDYYNGLDPVNRSVTPGDFINMLDPGDGTPGKGMLLSRVTDELYSLGYQNISLKLHASLDDLKSEIKQGPFIVTVGVKLAGSGTLTDSLGRAILGPGSISHAMVGKGIGADVIIVNDPWTGRELVFPMGIFESMWKLGLNGMYMIRP